MRFAIAAALFGAVLAAPNVAEIEERQAAASTTTVTAIDTIYSCPPSVTNCPSAAAAAATPGSGYTTSVVVDYIYHTITSCASTVTNCPARISTQTIELYTTVCPVAQAQASTTTVAPVPTTSVYVAPIQLSYVTYTTCIPSTYVSTITITPTPSPAPAAPTYSAAPTAYPNGTFTYTGPTATTNAAASVQGSFITVAAAALAAFLFA